VQPECGWGGRLREYGVAVERTARQLHTEPQPALEAGLVLLAAHVHKEVCQGGPCCHGQPRPYPGGVHVTAGRE